MSRVFCFIVLSATFCCPYCKLQGKIWTKIAAVQPQFFSSTYWSWLIKALKQSKLSNIDWQEANSFSKIAGAFDLDISFDVACYITMIEWSFFQMYYGCFNSFERASFSGKLLFKNVGLKEMGMFRTPSFTPSCIIIHQTLFNTSEEQEKVTLQRPYHDPLWSHTGHKRDTIKSLSFFYLKKAQ